MKKLILLLLVPFFIFAQKKVKLTTRNSLKVNLSSLLIKNYNFGYERTLSKHTSLLLHARLMPETTIPLESDIQKLIDDPTIKVSDFKLSNKAFTFEFRYYFGKKSNNGFYIAPYARWANFTAKMPINIDLTDPATNITVQNNSIFTGNFTSLSGGILFGIQKHLSNVVVLDFWIVGAHVGKMTADANLALNPNINTIYQRELTNNLEESRQNSPIDFTYSVSADNVKITTNSLAPGIRGLGLTLGVKF